MKHLVVTFFSGVVFALGLGLSQMTNPNKVLSFLDFFGEWDPSLAFVMGAALGINVFLFRVILKRDRPLFDTRFHLPEYQRVDTRLVAGSAIFGLGWGIAGFCPGAAIAAIPTGVTSVLLFLASMAGGMLLFRAAEAGYKAAKEGLLPGVEAPAAE